MKSILQNIIAYTHNLGFVNLVKITGTEDSLILSAKAEDSSILVTGTFNDPCAEIMGVFGMPNLSKLKTILSFDDYDADAKIEIIRKASDNNPEKIHFETKGGDFVNDYRLMATNFVEELIKPFQYKGKGWDVTCEPTAASILRLKKQAQANSEETTFKIKAEDNNLMFYFGDAATHSGYFVFATNVEGTLTRDWQWPINQVISILSLPGDKLFRINDQGAVEIVIDSGLAVYSYFIPALTK